MTHGIPSVVWLKTCKSYTIAGRLPLGSGSVQTAGLALLRLYLLTEHARCALDANGLISTRTTLTTAAVRAIMWNMSNHAEPHLYPSIPFRRLPVAHKAMRTCLAAVQRGYAR